MAYMNLNQFIESKWPPNAWIGERNIRIYVRRSVRLIGKDSIQCLDIGSVEVDERHRGNGIFTKFLKRFEKTANECGRAVFVESILNEKLREFLRKQGYAYVPNTSDISPCMYKLMTDDKPYCIIGLIDAYDAIHHRPISTNTLHKTHDYYWPNQTHKTWRFLISEWQLENSALSKDKLTPEEAEDINAFIRKHYTPPLWLIEGEEWEALGRPRSGKRYEKHRKKWDEIYERNKS